MITAQQAKEIAMPIAEKCYEDKLNTIYSAIEQLSKTGGTKLFLEYELPAYVVNKLITLGYRVVSLESTYKGKMVTTISWY